MWELKIHSKEKWNIYNKRTVKFNVKIQFNSINYYEEDEKFYFVGTGIVEGKEKNIQEFFKDLNKEKKVKYLEFNNNYFICIYFEEKTKSLDRGVKIAYNSKLIFLNPVIINENGWETWECGSIDRKVLEDAVKLSKENKNVEYKIDYLKKKKISSINTFKSFPKLTEKQKTALDLAIKNGYYEYPRKITLEELAKIQGVVLSTYQFHLRKAEGKLMPSIFR